MVLAGTQVIQVKVSPDFQAIAVSPATADSRDIRVFPDIAEVVYQGIPVTQDQAHPDLVDFQELAGIAESPVIVVL